ncbi:MAG: PKD domain-containing protein [Dehalococcoidia bacterium]
MFLTAVPAAAARSFDSVTLDGGSSVTVAPGATITVVMNVTTSGYGGNDDWRSTSWQIGGGGYACVDHADHSGDGSYSETFTITAPMTDGTYNVDFRAYEDNGCGGYWYDQTTLYNAVTVTGGGPGSDCIGWQSPTANAGSFDDPERAYADGGWPGSATAENNQTHYYYGYDFSAIPSGATIDGITVRLDARGNSSWPNGSFTVDLSWNEGYDWTTVGYTAGDFTDSEATYTVGGSTDTWGHTWTRDEIVNDLEVRLTAAVSGGSWASVNLDWVPVEVCYSTAAGYTLTTIISGSGSVNLTPPGGVYDPDDVVQLQALSPPGWGFDHWEGALSGSTNPTSIIMTDNLTVTAVFLPVTYSLTTNVIGSGSITSVPAGIDCPGDCFEGCNYGDTIQLTANPAPGWSFTGWAGDLGGTTNPETIVMDGNKDVTATFIETCGGVEIQLAMILDGSTSITSGNWSIMINGLAAAVNEGSCVPHDGTVELTVIQFGGMSDASAVLEVGPVVITAANAGTVASQIQGITQMTGYTPLACGLNLAADTLAGSPCFSTSLKQAINVVTDGIPNRCCNSGSYVENACPNCSTDGCDDANASAVAARNYLLSTLGMTTDQDEIDAEFIGESNGESEWLRDSIVWPTPGTLHPPESWPPASSGWVRVVDDASEFAATICEKFQVVICDLVADAGPDEEICAGDSVQIGGSPTASDGTPPYTYSWTPTDGLNNPTAANPNAAPYGTTTYTVLVTDDEGCTSSDSMTVTVNTSPIGTAPPITVCEGATEQDVQAAATTAGAGCDCGASPCDSTEIHYTPGDDHYTVNCENSGCTSEATGDVTIDPLPEANFSASPVSGCAPLVVQFTNLSTDSTSWNWDFGDGTGVSSDENPSYTYNNVGTYTVTLIAHNDCGDDTEEKIAYITVIDCSCDDCYDPVTDTYVSDTATGVVGGGNAVVAYDPSGWDSSLDYTFPTEAEWVWTTYEVEHPVDGDVVYFDRTITIPADATNIQGVLHITCDNGYEVSLNSTSVGSAQVHDAWRSSNLTSAYVDSSGWQNVESWNITSLLQTGANYFEFDCANEYMGPLDGQDAGTVESNPGGLKYEIEITYCTPRCDECEMCENDACVPDPDKLPTAGFTADPTEGCVELTVDFTDTSTSPVGSVSGWAWDFDNNGTVDSTEQDPQHTFDTPGTYTVKLVVSNTCGDSEPYTSTVTVHPLPDCTITAPDSVCEGNQATASVTPGSGYTYSWSVSAGNGSIVGSTTGSSVTFEAGDYASGTSLTLEVTVTSDHNCPKTCTKTVSIMPNPDCTITAPSEVCGGAQGITASVPVGNYADYSWTVTGDVNSVTGTGTREVTFNADDVTTTGNIHLEVTVTNTQTQCFCTSSADITVNPNPNCDITAPDAICEGNSDTASVTEVSGYTYAWSISGNGTLDGPTDQSSVGFTAGDYDLGTSLTLEVTVTNPATGCSSTCTKVVNINENPDCTFSFNFEPEAGVCELSTGHLVCVPDAGTGATYEWKHGGDITNVIVTDNCMTFDADAYYFGEINIAIQVTNANGCICENSVTIPVHESPDCEITLPGEGTCADSTGITASVADAGVDATYAWTIVSGDATITSGADTNSMTFDVGAAGDVTIGVTVTNANGCECRNTADFTVYPLPVADAGADQVILLGGSAAIGGDPTASGGTPSYTYSWTPSDSLDDAALANPVASPTVTTTYTVTVTDANGCVATDEVTILVRSGGGGGGGGPDVDRCYLIIDMLGERTMVEIDCCENCTLEQAMAYDENLLHLLELQEDTVVLCGDCEGCDCYPKIIVMSLSEENLDPPEGMTLVGPIYDFTGYKDRMQQLECQLVTYFNPTASVLLHYDPALLPIGATDPVIAFYSHAEGHWVILPPDPGRVAEVGVATGVAEYFASPFVVLATMPEAEPTPEPPATPPAPANFTASSLNISPSEASTGETVTISLNVANDGEESGTYTAELQINGDVVDSKVVTLSGGQSQPVSFAVSADTTGTYEASVAGLTGVFTVKSGSLWWLYVIIAIVVIGLGFTALRYRRSRG